MKKGAKSTSVNPKVLKDQVNQNDITQTEKEITSMLDNKKSDSPNILTNTVMPNHIAPFSRKAFIEKAFKGEFQVKSGKVTSVLQEFLWEYVIVLKNPDFRDLVNEAVTQETAQNFYKHCFKAKTTDSLQKDTLNFLQEVNAFEEAYKSLNDIDGGKSLYSGGRLSVVGESIMDNQTPAKDFTTLVRNALYYKLVSSLGLKAKQTASKTGEYIFLFIMADEEDLMIEAERISFNKQLEIALTDILSLIPCDENYRPLHVLKHDDEEIKKLFKDIKPFLTGALGLEKNTEKVDYRLEPSGTTQEMWNTYKVYLALLKDGIQKITAASSKKKGQMFLFQKLIKDSIEKANIGVRSRHQLKNLWTRMGIDKAVAPYAEYRRSSKEDELSAMWRTHEIDESGKRSLFRNVERLRILVSYIETEVGLNFLQEKKFIEAHFPLHNNWQLKGKNLNVYKNVPEEDRLLKNILYDFKPVNTDGPLISCWRTSLINQKVPLSKIKNYFGEKIALYFEFLRFYQTWLLVPALVGTGVYVIQRLYDAKSTQVLALNAFYSIFMTVWATVLMEGWKRNEATLAVEWGTTNYEQIEVPRPQYRGIKRRSPITDNLEEIYYPSSKRCKYLLLSTTVSLLILAIVLGIVAGLIILKKELADLLVYRNINFAGPICSIINAIQILIFNVIYSKLAKIMTDLENHKTENQYQDSYVLKVFAFQFVNSFNSLVYIAFAKGYVEGCLNTDVNGKVVKNDQCMNELYTQLISIFIVSYIKNIVEIAVPFIKYQLKKRKKGVKVQNTDDGKDIRSKVETQLYLEYYQTRDIDGTIDDYMEIAIQFGYVTLFAIAFPLSTALAFVGFWLEMFTDKLKVLRLVRRPIPLTARDIGTWYNIFSAVCVFAIFSNTALFCFTAQTFNNIDLLKNYNYVVFAIVVVVLLLFRAQLQSWIPDVPGNIQVVQARHDFIKEKVLRGEIKCFGEPDEEVFDTSIYFTSLAGNTKITELV